MTARETKILQMLIEEYTASGHECIEHMGEYFARITWREGKVVQMTDVNLTRLADQISQRLERWVP